MQAYLRALDEASQKTGAPSASDGQTGDEEKKIEAHLAALGYVED
jgi:hypothetical protein